MEFPTFCAAMMEMPCQIVRSKRRLIFRLLSWNPWARSLPAAGQAAARLLAVLGETILKSGSGCPDPRGPSNQERDLNHVAGLFPQIKGFDWVLDNLNTHWSLEVCRVTAQLCDVPFDAAVLQTGKQRRAFLTDPTHKHVFHFTPTHGSWLNQVELWFSVFGRRFLKRGDFASMEDFEARLLGYVEDYNRSHAHPYRWTYTGTPLVRETPFSQTRCQQRRGARGLVPAPTV